MNKQKEKAGGRRNDTATAPISYGKEGERVSRAIGQSKNWKERAVTSSEVLNC